jgi:hypothetical protein
MGRVLVSHYEMCQLFNFYSTNFSGAQYILVLKFLPFLTMPMQRYTGSELVKSCTWLPIVDNKIDSERKCRTIQKRRKRYCHGKVPLSYITYTHPDLSLLECS